MRLRYRYAVSLAGLLSVLVLPARAQQAGGGSYDVSVRRIPLVEALTQFARMTGESVSFDPALVAPFDAYCSIERANAEALLSCLLDASRLDYIQLSSGTYVIVPAAERLAVRGTLIGQVTDRRSGRPLPDAHVYLASAEGGLGTITGRDGHFTLPPLLPGTYVLTTSYLGYRVRSDTLSVAPGAEAFTRIELASEALPFTPLVIDGIQRARPSERLGVARIALADTLSTVDSGVLGTALRALPGVRINDLTADIHIQGGEAGDHQFTLDGAPVFLPRSLSGMLTPFSPLAIERITVHKSGFGAREGSHLAGVTALAQVLEDDRRLDVQFDPLSLNARLTLAGDRERGLRPRLMAAYRTSMQDLMNPGWLSQTLNEWTRPDAFLILAPYQGRVALAPSLFEEQFRLEESPNPQWSFDDLHLAGRVWTSALNTLHASYYRGTLAFAGDLAPRNVLQNELENDSTRISLNEAAALAVVDAYDAVSETAQLRYNAVLGNRTLASLQARLSRHRMDHNYVLLDSLELLLPEVDVTPEFPEERYAFPTRPVADLSRIAELGFEAHIEHAASRHLLSAGVASVHRDGAFRLLLSAQSDAPAEADLQTAPDPLRDRVATTSRAWQHALFLEDRFDFSGPGSLEAGIRLTYLPSHATVFAEPRLALRFDWPFGASGALALRTGAGLYRQYLSQFDVSTFNAGAIFPSMRVWLPVDRSLQPPKAYHLSQSVLLQPNDAWTFRMEAYLKGLPHSVSLNYLFIDALADERGGQTDQNVVSVERQQSFLAIGEALLAGGSASVAFDRRPWRLQAGYDANYGRRRSPALFDGRRTTLPWVVPHRLTASVAAFPIDRLLLALRFQGEWGRSWAFRQAYYDYLGQRAGTRLQPPYDLSDPQSHTLAPYYQVDLSVAYEQPAGASRLQFRIESLNLLNRRNEVDWRLVTSTDRFVRQPRYLYPRSFSLAVRWIW